jgi:hypothetical protein
MSQQLFRSVRLLILTVVLLALTAPNLLSPNSVSWADVGELPEVGGLVTPGDKTDEIRMKSESVLFSVQPNDGTFEQPEVEYYSQVTADFLMENLTSNDVSKDLFFPFHSTLDLGTFEDPLYAHVKQAKDVHVLVQGLEVPVSYIELTLSSQQKVIAAVFSVNFPAGSETTIQIQYDLRAVHEPKSPLLSFKYLMETGSHWAGTIGSGEVRFEFWTPIEGKSALAGANDFFEVQDGALVWRFADLEPDPSHNISVSLDPARFGSAEQGTGPTLPDALTVRALIDGRSQLVVRGGSVYWHHLDFAAPGRWQDPETQRAYDEPTYLNGAAWYPTWPDQPDRENRDCGCNSSSIAGIAALARQDQTASLSVEQARGPVTIIQQPEAGNDYTLIVEFDDGGPGGADWYEVTLRYVTSGAAGSIPVAHPQTVTTPQDTPVDITLIAFHAEGKLLTFALVAGPSHGILIGSAPNLVYQPEPGYAGSDAFTFQASDGLHDSEVAQVRLIVGLPRYLTGVCTGPNLLRNGDFEAGFDGQGVGLGWGSFHTEGGAIYGFQDDQWPFVIYEGSHSQLIGISTGGTSPEADRFAGIYQTVTGLEPGAVYELSIAGMMREEAAHPDEDSFRYQVQWAYSSQVHGDWMLVAGWQELPWAEISLRTEPDAFSIHTARLVAPSQPLTLFIRAWSKWALPDRELDINLDAIALRRCGFAPTAKP